jgi:hypothetical protein
LECPSKDVTLIGNKKTRCPEQRATTHRESNRSSGQQIGQMPYARLEERTNDLHAVAHLQDHFLSGAAGAQVRGLGMIAGGGLKRANLPQYCAGPHQAMSQSPASIQARL